MRNEHYKKIYFAAAFCGVLFGALCVARIGGIYVARAANASSMILAGGATVATEAIKLPYEKGQEFVVVQGYHSPPTHVGKDAYALDLSQDGCDAYGKTAVAASAGRVVLAQESGYNGGYGTQVLVEDGAAVFSRYAHLIPGSLGVVPNVYVARGEPLGAMGDSGLVAGFACPIHPGTHIHFAMYDLLDDGVYVAHLPEPISGYAGLHDGAWYLSDNVMDDGANSVATGSMPVVPVGGVSVSLPSIPSPSPEPPNEGDVNIASSTDAASSTEVASDTTSTSSTIDATSVPLMIVTAPTPPNGSGAVGEFNSSTLAVDFAWQASQSIAPSSSVITYGIFDLDAGNTSGTPIAITTSTSFSYVATSSDFGHDRHFGVAAADDLGNSSALTPLTITFPNWDIVFQPLADVQSADSWYSDDWYDLGTGFSGSLRSLTLEGFIKDPAYRTSRLWLEEYSDPDYSQLVQTYTLSEDAPFTNVPGDVTIGDLDFPLQPDKYYRLSTEQDLQNTSVTLMGTHSTGTAMYDDFSYGIGKIYYTYPFYPYLSAIIIPYPSTPAPVPIF